MRCQIFEASATKIGINPTEAFVSYDAHVKKKHIIHINKPTWNEIFSPDEVKIFPWSSIEALEDTKSNIISLTPFEMMEATCIPKISAVTLNLASRSE